MSDREICRFVVLWAASARYSRPQFVAAFSGGLEDAMVEVFDAKMTEAKEWFLGFDAGEEDSDGPWEFWMTHEVIEYPTVVRDA